MKTAIALLALALSAAAHGSDVHVELGAGQTKYGLQSDGIWYQIGMPHRINSNGRAYKIGLTGDAYANDDWGVAWHADYMNLGHLRSECNCTTVDQLYNTKTHSIIPGKSYIPIAKYSGHGGVQGVLLSLAPYLQVGDWRIGAEAGLFPYRPTWKMTVYDWPASHNGPFITGQHNALHTWQLGKVVGAFVQNGRFTASYEFYRLPTRFDDTHNPGLWTGAHVLMVSYEL